MASTDEDGSNVETQIEGALRGLNDLEHLLGAPTYDDETAQIRLLDIINGYVKTLGKIQENTKIAVEEGGIGGLEVPIAAVGEIDEGRNPDIWLQRQLAQTFKANQAARGRLSAMTGLHESLLKKASERFPDEAAEYQGLLSGRRNSDKESLHSEAGNAERNDEGNDDATMADPPPQSEPTADVLVQNQGQTTNETEAKADIKTSDGAYGDEEDSMGQPSHDHTKTETRISTDDNIIDGSMVKGPVSSESERAQDVQINDAKGEDKMDID